MSRIEANASPSLIRKIKFAIQVTYNAYVYIMGVTGRIISECLCTVAKYRKLNNRGKMARAKNNPGRDSRKFYELDYKRYVSHD